VPADPGHDEGFFGERVASVYDEHAADMFDPAVVAPVVDLLAGRAAAAGPLGRLAARAVHQPQPGPRLGVREALSPC